MTDFKLVCIEITLSSVDQERLLADICAQKNPKEWSVTKGLDGATLLIGAITIASIKALTKILIIQLEQRGNSLVEVTIDKKKYKFKGLVTKDAIALVKSFHDGKSDA